MQPADGLAPLEYALPPPPPRRWPRMKVVRWLIIVVALVAFIPVSKTVVRLWNQVGLSILKRRCLGRPVQQGVLVFSSSNPAAIVLSSDAVAFEKFTSTGFYTSYQLPQATVFTGELQAKNGTRRFVDVEVRAGFINSGSYRIEFIENAFDESGNSGGGVSSTGSTVRSWNRKDVLIYSATKDPADPSHISFRYSTPDATNQVDIRLRSDGALQRWYREVGP